MNTADSVEMLISEIGGAALLSKELGLPLTTVVSWIDRNSISPRYWVAIVEVAKRLSKRAVSFKRLAVLHQEYRVPQAGVGVDPQSSP